MFFKQRSHNNSVKSVGKVPSDKDKFMRVVLGPTRASMHDLSKEVGIQSREQVALEDVKIICFTSAVVAGVKSRRAGGGTIGGQCGDNRGAVEKEAYSLLILSPKK